MTESTTKVWMIWQEFRRFKIYHVQNLNDMTSGQFAHLRPSQDTAWIVSSSSSQHRWTDFPRQRSASTVQAPWLPGLPCRPGGMLNHSNWLHSRNVWNRFLSASLHFSKRCAYWDRLCRDVVGRWLVGRWLVVTRVHCGQTVHPRPIVTMEH